MLIEIKVKTKRNIDSKVKRSTETFLLDACEGWQRDDINIDCY